ncbi:hypothetical protein JL720_9969 [Aureococcus anophagefferens]|nr:hypothetical protein JL720_9969 [Aureococcus anophagefferens]
MITNLRAHRDYYRQSPVAMSRFRVREREFEALCNEKASSASENARLKRELQRLGEVHDDERAKLEAQLGKVIHGRSPAPRAGRGVRDVEAAAHGAHRVLSKDVRATRKEICRLRDERLVLERKTPGATRDEVREMQTVMEAWQAQAVALQRELEHSKDLLRAANHDAAAAKKSLATTAAAGRSAARRAAVLEKALATAAPGARPALEAKRDDDDDDDALLRASRTPSPPLSATAPLETEAAVAGAASQKRSFDAKLAADARVHEDALRALEDGREAADRASAEAAEAAAGRGARGAGGGAGARGRAERDRAARARLDDTEAKLRESLAVSEELAATHGAVSRAEDDAHAAAAAAAAARAADAVARGRRGRRRATPLEASAALRSEVEALRMAAQDAAAADVAAATRAAAAAAARSRDEIDALRRAAARRRQAAGRRPRSAASATRRRALRSRARAPRARPPRPRAKPPRRRSAISRRRSRRGGAEDARALRPRGEARGATESAAAESAARDGERRAEAASLERSLRTLKASHADEVAALERRAGDGDARARDLEALAAEAAAREQSLASSHADAVAALRRRCDDGDARADALERRLEECGSEAAGARGGRGPVGGARDRDAGESRAALRAEADAEVADAAERAFERGRETALLEERDRVAAIEAALSEKLETKLRDDAARRIDRDREDAARAAALERREAAHADELEEARARGIGGLRRGVLESKFAVQIEAAVKLAEVEKDREREAAQRGAAEPRQGPRGPAPDAPADLPRENPRGAAGTASGTALALENGDDFGRERRDLEFAFSERLDAALLERDRCHLAALGEKLAERDRDLATTRDDAEADAEARVKLRDTYWQELLGAALAESDSKHAREGRSPPPRRRALRDVTPRGNAAAEDAPAEKSLDEVRELQLQLERERQARWDLLSGALKQPIAHGAPADVAATLVSLCVEGDAGRPRRLRPRPV